MSVSDLDDQWIDDIRKYCRKLNIETKDLYSVLSDPKVSPMIRGKAFEFSLSYRLSQILASDEWTVSKPTMNAQSNAHDVDVKVLHNPTETVISVECKLAKKGSFRVAKRKYRNRDKNDYFLEVKCMRSRTTLSDDRVRTGAAAHGVTKEAFKLHSDQYRAVNFDVVATSIANAFYETEEDTGMYIFQPSENARKLFEEFNPPNDEEELQLFIYNKIYLARSMDLAVTTKSGVECGRRNCTDRSNCGFIPNSPLINFGNIGDLPPGKIPAPNNHWVELKDAESLFRKSLPTN